MLKGIALVTLLLLLPQHEQQQHLSSSLGIAAAAAQQPPARPLRPSLPRTFLKLELEQFPTLQGGCSKITRTLQVGPNRQYRNISAALAAATPFTRITVAPGTYAESNGPIAYLAALDIKVSDLCIVSTGGPSRTRIVPDPAAGTARGLMISSNRVTVSGFTLDGFAAGVFLGSSTAGGTQTGVTLANLVIIGKGADPQIWSGGLIVPYADGRASGVPVVDGLLMSGVEVRDVQMGISCDLGPCWHWWLDNVNITNVGGDGFGADAFAVESGRQVIVTRSSFQGQAGDGIDVKGPDVLVWRSRVSCERGGRTGIKLWAGGDVQDSSIDACDSLDASAAARYRYLRVNITRNSFHRRSYVGVWGYLTKAAVDLEISSCIVRDSPDSGGFSLRSGSKLKLTNNVFWDVGTRLIEFGNFDDAGNIVYIATDAAGLAEVERRGWGSGNKLGGV